MSPETIGRHSAQSVAGWKLPDWPISQGLFFGDFEAPADFVALLTAFFLLAGTRSDAGTAAGAKCRDFWFEAANCATCATRCARVSGRFA
jgi:hypothetical protein